VPALPNAHEGSSIACLSSAAAISGVNDMVSPSTNLDESFHCADRASKPVPGRRGS
jgi:hypothetical protein